MVPDPLIYPRQTSILDRVGRTIARLVDFQLTHASTHLQQPLHPVPRQDLIFAIPGTWIYDPHTILQPTPGCLEHLWLRNSSAKGSLVWCCFGYSVYVLGMGVGCVYAACGYAFGEVCKVVGGQVLGESEVDKRGTGVERIERDGLKSTQD